MSCNCGQKREALTTPAVSRVTLRSLNPSPVSITAFSGARYRFDEKGSTQPVDKGDVEALLATGLFERDRVR